MKLSDRILNILFPPRCVSCDELIDPDKTNALCPHCRAKYEIEKEFLCPECQSVHKDCTCMPKILSRQVNEAMHLLEYTKEECVARDLVLHAKDGRYEYLYRMLESELAALVAHRVKSPEACLFTFVPRSRRRKLESGVDQSQEVAKRLAGHFGGDFAKLILSCKAHEQKNLTASERRENREASYRLARGAEEQIRGRHILLYDDVVTTGATLSACAKLLKKAGARSICVISFAKVYLETKSMKNPTLK